MSRWGYYMRVKIENYQAIKNADLFFDVGLTAIVGPTNSGKSSLIRAIKGAINNQTGTGFINYNADESVVSIEDNGNTIVWTKPRKGSATYTLNGREISKVGRTQNEEVANLLNMSEVEVSTQKIRLNFWEQMEKAFLMDKTPNQLFEFISQSKEQELMQSYQQTEQNSLTEIEKQIKVNETKLDVYKQEIQKLDNRATELVRFNAIDINQIQSLIKLKNSVETNLERFYDTISEINLLRDKVLVQTNFVKSIKSIDNELRQRFLLRDKIIVLENIISSGTKQITGLNNNIVGWKNNIKQLDKIVTDFNSIITKHSELVHRKETIKLLNQKHITATTAVDVAKKDIDYYKQVISKITTELNTFSVCPFCGSSLNHGEESCHE